MAGVDSSEGDDFWIAQHGERREHWSELDALKLQKEYSKKNLKAPPWFLGSPRGAIKLKEKHRLGVFLLASSELAEMASRKEVAHWRFSRVSAGLPKVSMANFPACGAGLDWLHFLEAYPSFVAQSCGGDLDLCASQIARSNLNFVLQKSWVVCYDALRPPFKHIPNFTFLDPARRSDGERLERYDYRPSLQESLAELEGSSLAQIKLAPGESPDRLSQYTERGWRWEWVQRGRDIVECFGTWISEDFLEMRDQLPSWTATCLDGSGAWKFSFSGHQELEGFQDLIPLESGQVIVQPKTVLQQSGLLAAWQKVWKCEPSEAEDLFVCKEPCPNMCDSFELKGVIDKPKALLKNLTEFKNLPMEFRSLVHPVPKDWLSKISPLLAQKGHPEERITLMLTKAAGHLVLLVLGPIR